MEERPGGRQCRGLIGPGHPCFEGHLDGFPIFPGIAQIALVLAALEEAPQRPQHLLAIQSVRLRSPVRPGDDLVLSVGRPGENGRVGFTVRRGNQIAAQGAIVVDIGLGHA